MSDSPPPDLTTTQPLVDNSNMKLNQTTHIVIENSSDDITISKCDQNQPREVPGSVAPSAVPLKAQVLPLVYVTKNNNSKFPFVVNPAKKPGGNNFIISPAAPLLTNTKSSTATTVSISTPQNVVFAGRGRPLMLPKQPLILQQGPKMTGTYVTMLKPVPKPEVQVTVHSSSDDNISTNVTSRDMPCLKVPNTVKVHHPENVTQPQKFILTGPIPKISRNKLIAPSMPKLQPLRQPVTATTDCLQPSKFTVLPLSVPPKEQITNQKMFNFQISDGKIFSNVAAPVTIMCENQNGPLESSCEGNDVINKTYELSITEEEPSSEHEESKMPILSSADSNSSVENAVNNKQGIKFAHGVSILKKNFFPNLLGSDSKKNENSASNFVNKNSTSHDLTILKPSNGMEEKVVVTVSNAALAAVKKPEKNRRKSQFNFRKDFDDMEVSFPDNDDDDDDDSKLVIKSPDNGEADIKEEDDVPVNQQENTDEDVKPLIIEIKSENKPAVVDPKAILDIKLSEEEDATKLLQWENNVGCLPGTNLKFTLNEFGIIEYLSEPNYQKVTNNKQIKQEKNKRDLERDVQCFACGCYGILADFVDSEFCSIDCQSRLKAKPNKEKENIDSMDMFTTTNNKTSKRKLTIQKSRSDNDIKTSNDVSEEEDTSNDASKDKFTYPWACKKKGFSWSKYLMHVGAIAAPVKLFKDPFPYSRNLFRPGMKLEGVDPQHPSYFCVLTVADTSGYRVRLHFDGYSENYDFWTYADSPNIFPMGWCEKYGHVLRPPPGYTEDSFNWLQYLRVTRSTAAPKQLFVNRAGQAICPNGFRIGMKLEAVDKKNTSLICVATVRDMMDNRILVHFDGWDDIYDYWADPTSPYIHPVGWCDQYGHDLTSPSDYPTPENFTWEKYLKETKSVAAPVRAFKQRPACGFKRGMRLECVDKRVPHLIRVATVDDVKEHQIRIHFDGWPDRYSYWVDDDSPDIHPIGWCQKTGHPLEPPLTPDDVFQFIDCPTVGCRGEGHFEGLKFTRHSTTRSCPYAEDNIDRDRGLPDRLLSPDQSPEAKEPVSRQARNKPKLGRPPKWLKELNRARREQSDEPSEKRPRKQYSKRVVTKSQNGSIESSEDKALSFIESAKILPAEQESWRRHSQFLNDFIVNDTDAMDPASWTRRDVIDFVSSIPGCNVEVTAFLEHKIDGEAFLQLSQSDILNILKIKMGPAIKVYNSIVLLREQFCDRKRKKN